MSGEVTTIPIPTRLGALLCRLGWHKWGELQPRTTVIPTGGALLITAREEIRRCDRYMCRAKLEVHHYERTKRPNRRERKERGA